MFIPSYNNNLFLFRCSKCGMIRSAFATSISINNSVCDKCIAEDTEKPKEQTGFFNDNILLPVYYKRKIELTFQKSESKDIANKYMHLYTVMMIPNTENWLKEKLEEAKKKMEKAGLEKIEFKILDKYSEMDDISINYYSQQDNCQIDCGYQALLCLPFIAEHDDSNEEKIIKSLSAIYKHVIKKWSGMDWLELIMKILTVIMIIILLPLCAFLFVVFVSEIIAGHYSHSIGPFVLATLCFAGSYVMIKIVKDNF